MTEPSPLESGTLSRRELFGACAAAPLAWAGVQAATPKAKTGASGERASSEAPRNVLLLVADDVSATDLAAYGNPKSATPRIDAFAREGLRLERFYTPTAICQPARACLYTGLSMHRSGAVGFVPIRDEVATMAELLPRERVAGALIGKVHGQPVSKFRFEFFRPHDSEDFGSTRGPTAYLKHFGDFLDSAGERPFCAVVNFLDPHRPFDEGGRPSNSRSPDDVFTPPNLIDCFGVRVELAKYYDALTRLDETVGALLDLLAQRGLSESTLVVFVSDNGSPFPFAKTTLYEAGLRLPAFVRWPGVVKPGASSKVFTGLLDLLPTVLDTFGVERSPHLEGASLLPLLRGEGFAKREIVFSSHECHARNTYFPMRSVRDERFKYIVNFQPDWTFQSNITEFGPLIEAWRSEARTNEVAARRLELFQRRPLEELYDLQEDPWELANLAEVSERRAVRDDLRAKLRAVMQAESDTRLAQWPFKG